MQPFKTELACLQSAETITQSTLERQTLPHNITVLRPKTMMTTNDDYVECGTIAQVPGQVSHTHGALTVLTFF